MKIFKTKLSLNFFSQRFFSFALSLFIFSYFFIGIASEPEDFPYQKEITLKNKKSESIYLLKIDNEIYQKTPNLYQQLRIFDDQKKEIPFILTQLMVPAQKEQQFHSVPLKITAFRKLDGNSVEIDFEQTSESIEDVSRIKIKTTAKNFDKQMMLYERQSDKKRRLLCEMPFFDYSSQIDLRNDQIDFAATKVKYFTLVIKNYQEYKDSPYRRIVQRQQSLEEEMTLMRRELKIDEIFLYSLNSKNLEPQLVEYPISNLTIKETPQRTTLISVTSNGVPISQIKFLSNTSNFVRRYCLKDHQSQIIASGVLKSVTWGKNQTINQLDINFKPIRNNTFSIEIWNEDDQPLESINLIARGPQYILLLTPPPDQKLSLYYGDIPSEKPHYDLSKYLQYNPLNNYQEAVLGETIKNPHFKNITQWNYRKLFYFILGGSVILIIYLLWVSSKRIEKIDSQS